MTGCPRCQGSGRVAVGPWGSRPPRVDCTLCAGTGQLSAGTAAVLQVLDDAHVWSDTPRLAMEDAQDQLAAALRDA